MSEAAVLDVPQSAPPTPSPAPSRDPAAGDLRTMTTDEFRSRLDTAFNKIPDAKRVKAKAAKAPATPEPTAVPETPKPTPPATPEAASPTPESQPAPEAEDDIKSQTTWEKYKKGYKLSQEQAKQIEDYRKQVESAAAQQQEYDRVQKELRESQELLTKTRGELYQYDVTRTPEWSETVETPANKIITEAERSAAMNGVDGGKFMDAVYLLAKGDKSGLTTLLEGVDAETAADLRSEAKEYAKGILAIRERMDYLKTNAKEAIDTSNRKREEAMRQNQEQYWKVFDGALSAVGEKVESTISKFLPEDHDLNFTEIRSNAREIDKWSPEERALAGYSAWALPSLIGALETWQKRALAAEEQNSKLRNGAPKVTQGSSASAPGITEGKKTDYKGMSGKQFASESAGRIRAALGLPSR